MMEIIRDKEIEDFLNIAIEYLTLKANKGEETATVAGVLKTTKENFKLKNDIVISIVLFDSSDNIIGSCNEFFYRSSFFKEEFFSEDIYNVNAMVSKIKVFCKRV